MGMDSLAVEVVEAEAVGVGQAAQVDGGDASPVLGRHEEIAVCRRRQPGKGIDGSRWLWQPEVRDTCPCKQQNVKLHP